MKTTTEINKKIVEQSAFQRFFSVLGMRELANQSEGRVDALLWVLGKNRNERAKAIKKTEDDAKRMRS